MYHGRFHGNHYEIGFRWGSRLAKHANYILNNIPFHITEERLRFAQYCLPIYQEFFPEILEEIQGIACLLYTSTTKMFIVSLPKETFLSLTPRAPHLCLWILLGRTMHRIRLIRTQLTEPSTVIPTTSFCMC